MDDADHAAMHTCHCFFTQAAARVMKAIITVIWFQRMIEPAGSGRGGLLTYKTTATGKRITRLCRRGVI